MQSVANTVLDQLLGLWPYALVFAALALVTKRANVFEALRRCQNETITNALLFFFNALVTVPLILFPSFLLSESIDAIRIFGDEDWGVLPDALTIVIAVLAIDFAAYWRHRFEHSPSLWRIHATHHADTAIHWLSVHRKHPAGRALAFFFDLTAAWLIGLPIWAIAIAGVIRAWWGCFIHADVPWTLGPVGKVLISPAAHRLHHIRDEQLMGYNFGNTVTLWDKLFGTYLDPAPYVDCETGIAEGTRGFFGELARPFEKRYRSRSGDEPHAPAPGSSVTGP